ncbi:hypothetical protein D9756_001638 [Leucocoprinus leucothites]|uniref:Non-structural maintenance of chromosomes element 1 homolog n=1 Tax=Leucocoprinus leucothites TaxID=201217 RepID=A0A8H5G3P6_9AGAR|nr:hypothetical protein D9756_001638 [Leucoagaricus leucothites]
MVQQADVNRLFLQSMLSRGSVPEKLARTIWKKCVEAVNAVSKDGRIPFREDGWQNFVNVINVSLDKLELHFRSFEDQRTGQLIYSIVNLKGDAIAQMATEYTPAEIAYFKALVEQIMLAPRHKYSVSSLVALREVSMIKPKTNITKSQAEVVLSTFVARGWLVKSKNGRYSLSPRSLLELRPYLQLNYSDQVLRCYLCEEILTIGVACVHEGCKCKMHPVCFKKYSKAHKTGTLPCKDCEQEWPRDINSEDFIPIGEKAVRKGEQEQRVRAGGGSDGEDENEDYEDQGVDMESQSQSQPMQTQARKTSKSKGKQSKVTVENETDEDAPPATSTKRPRQSNRR